MTGIILIIAVTAWVLLYRPTVNQTDDLPIKLSEKLDQLWAIAQDSIRENKYLRAEKALLTILRVDQKNATAYNRLGILYAKQRAYKDAIECFEIAQSIEPSASSLHNVGLIYYETGDYAKSALAFEQSIEMEDDLAARYIAYAKTQEKLGNTRKMIDSLEKAVELEPIPQTLTVLAEAYDTAGQQELAASLREKAARLLVPAEPKSRNEPRTRTQRTPRQPRKLVM